MGLCDVFGSEDRIQLKVNELVDYFRDEARMYVNNTVMINGLKAGVPSEHILIMMGESNTDLKEG